MHTIAAPTDVSSRSFLLTETATDEISTLSLHYALPSYLTDAGNLATADRADLDYTDGADGTNTILQEGTEITGGGIILSGGGKISTFGKDTYADTTAGFFLGWDTAAVAGYKFNIGKADSHMKWSAADGLQVQSGDTTVKGVTINAGGDNQIDFYGSIAPAGATAKLATVGVDVGVGGTANVAIFGPYTVGTTNAGLEAGSCTKSALSGYTDNGKSISGDC